MAADPSLAEQKSFAFFNMNQTEKCLNCLRNVCFVHSETGDMESETPGVMGHPDYAQSGQDQGQGKVAGVYRMREVIKVTTIRSTEATTPAAPAAHFNSLQSREAQSVPRTHTASLANPHFLEPAVSQKAVAQSVPMVQASPFAFPHLRETVSQMAVAHTAAVAAVHA
eukprot:TRINITY_DN197_c0_g1_i21.p2 TRINITY_DN197_c0_g1~~TRINITY_DN197_c0_g1_i21.p2  ORF type:complete len:168 (-),score=34.20 TRINITY_DN197_c0_g1_i21:387-890(-)